MWTDLRLCPCGYNLAYVSDRGKITPVSKEKPMVNREVWEGWTVRDFIEALEPQADMIMSGRSWHKPFRTREELKAWCGDNQPYYKKPVPEVVAFFAKKYRL